MTVHSRGVALVLVHIDQDRAPDNSSLCKSCYARRGGTLYKTIRGVGAGVERHNILPRCFTRMDHGERLLQTRVSGSGHA